MSDRWLLHLGDCVDFMSTLADGSVDVSICDPPYETEAHTKQRRALKDATQKRGAVNVGAVRRVDATLPFAAISEDVRERAASEMARVTRRWIIAFCQIEAIFAWKASFTRAGLEWIRGGVWIKPNGMPQFTGDRPSQGFECLAIAHRPGRKRWNGGGRHAVWTYPIEHNAGRGGQLEHPTTKSKVLMRALIEDFSDPGEVVMDPFAGSGTTGVAALGLGRRFLGCEINPAYHALAIERLAAEEAGSTVEAARAGQIAMFGGR